MSDIPDGFEATDIKSAFVQQVATFYVKKTSRGRVVAARVAAHHCNLGGFAHGAFLMTLADFALSIGSFEPGDVPPKITLSLSMDFVDSARLGDWVEAHVDVQKTGRTIVFANCFLCVGEDRIARASGVFRPTANLAPAAPN